MAEHPSSERLRHLVWLLPVAFGLHEAEEWNIVPWFQAHFVPRTELTDLAARTLLVAFTLAALLYSAGASLLLGTRALLLAVLPLTGEQLSLHRLANRLAIWLWGAT
jgi:hypothetical protein